MVTTKKGLEGSVSGRVVVDFKKLVEKAREYLPPEKLSVIEEAYKFAAEKHQGQVRLSGEPFLDHPLQTAYILA